MIDFYSKAIYISVDYYCIASMLTQERFFKWDNRRVYSRFGINAPEKADTFTVFYPDHFKREKILKIFDDFGMKHHLNEKSFDDDSFDQMLDELMMEEDIPIDRDVKEKMSSIKLLPGRDHCTVYYVNDDSSRDKLALIVSYYNFDLYT
eukprot:TRINITY_DN4317_c0_g1_i1.p1 TRINITY_DN4317_c0_g1~~TRINITY_DN4317_c0_g1_i1.p1  ORF type:complete len:149 (+),score=28.07 TRINITY_DN4317_c0_g1_i1:569-1015(+)